MTMNHAARTIAAVGFSLTFIRVHEGDAADGDRVGARAFLESRGLRTDGRHETSAHLVDAAGRQIAFDGHWTDLHLNPLDSEVAFSGGIWHATLGDEECTFIFDLCVAAGFLICNHQGEPAFIVPARNHALADLDALVDDPSVAFVESAAELREALSGGFGKFVEYRDRVIGERS